VKRLREIQLTPHRGLGDRGDRAFRARLGCQHLDDLACTSVESTSNTMSRFARRSRL